MFRVSRILTSHCGSVAKRSRKMDDQTRGQLGHACKSEVTLRGITRGRDYLCGMNHQNRGHSERSAARAKAGRHGVEESREFSQDVRIRDRTLFRHSTGFFTAHRPTAKAPADAPFRMTSGEVHWQRSSVAGAGGDGTQSKHPAGIAGVRAFVGRARREAGCPR